MLPLPPLRAQHPASAQDRRSRSPRAARLTMHGGALFSICLLLAAFVPPAQAEDVSGLVRDAAYNEVHSHTGDGGWEYRVDKHEDGHLLTGEQAETAQGPVFRLLAIDGRPLTPKQQQQELDRIRNLLHHPRLQQKAEKAWRADEKTLLALIGQLPAVFLYRPVGMQGENEVLSFRPNPAAHPDGYEGRVIESMEGELVINLREKRIVRFSGRLFQKVEFGYGLLGRLDPGGTFSVEREEPFPGSWKTSLIHIDISGRFSFFATITREEDERHSAFRQVPRGLTAAQGYKLLGVQ